MYNREADRRALHVVWEVMMMKGNWGPHGFYKLHVVLVIAVTGLLGLRPGPASSQEIAAAKPVLSGRITDEHGAPVSDARIELFHVESGTGSSEVRTGNNGDYAVNRVDPRGEHRLLVFSNRCIGFTKFDDCPRVTFDPQKPTVRNFVLKLACQLRVQALDEEGHPVAKVQFFASGPILGSHAQTDWDGWARIGGLAASASERKFGAYRDDFALMPLHLKLDDPKTVVERKLVMKRGVDVKGIAICSDGKPAAGWRILALPAWWDFMSYPNGEPINANGSFVLRHIGPGLHNVNISIPNGEGSSLSRPALRAFELAAQTTPLTIKLDFPSAGSMGQIEGRIRYSGGRRPKRGLWINADREDRQPFFGNVHVAGDVGTFRIGPLPAGQYHLQFTSDEIEPKNLASITAPAKDLQVDIHVLPANRSVRGTVVTDRAHGQKVVADFRFRVVRLRSPNGGPNHSIARNWRRVIDPQGRFTEELPGPGVYQVETMADGFATWLSKAIDTNESEEKDLRIELTKGIRLTGTVVDEEGRPINGATVISLSRAGWKAPLSAAGLPAETGVSTVDGRFEFAALDPGRDTFHIIHPDYATVIHNVFIRPGDQTPLVIVMHPGGMVEGHVHDHFGRLAANVTLHFRRYASAGDQQNSRFATAVTDENGY